MFTVCCVYISTLRKHPMIVHTCSYICIYVIMSDGWMLRISSPEVLICVLMCVLSVCNLCVFVCAHTYIHTHAY